MSSLRAAACLLALILTLAACGAAHAAPATVQADLRTGRGAGPALVAVGAVWVPNEDDGTVSRIDPANNRVVATVTIGDPKVMLAEGCGVGSVHSLMWDTLIYRRCSLPSALASDGRSIWAADNADEGLDRIDPRTNQIVQKLSVGANPFRIAFGFGSLWVTSYFHDPHEVLRIDPVSGRVLATITGPEYGGTGIAVGAGAVWVAATYGGSLARIDPATNSITAMVPVGSYPLAVAAGYGSVWVRNEDSSSISRVDPASDQVVETIDGLFSPGEAHMDDSLAVGPDGLYTAGVQLYRVDPRRDGVTATIDVTGSAVAEGAGSLWLTSVFGTLERINPASARAVQSGG